MKGWGYALPPSVEDRLSLAGHWSILKTKIQSNQPPWLKAKMQVHGHSNILHVLSWLNYFKVVLNIKRGKIREITSGSLSQQWQAQSPPKSIWFYLIICSTENL